MVTNQITRPVFLRIKNFLRIARPFLLMGVLCMLINGYDSAFLNSITDRIKHYPTEYLIFRWGMLCSFIFFWPLIIFKIGKKREAISKKISDWRADAWRIGVWLIIIELLVCENLITKTIHLLK